MYGDDVESNDLKNSSRAVLNKTEDLEVESEKIKRGRPGQTAMKVTESVPEGEREEV